MTIGELREILSSLPDELEVIIAKDAEGNDFSPLSELSLQRYVAHTDWSGELVSVDDVEFIEDAHDELDFDYDAPDVYDVICLWPTY